MIRSESVPAVVLVPVDLINVINPRVRNKKTFNEIIANIADVGLKRPITVALRDRPDGKRYDLVCGQGRLEAFQALGQREIPAIVVEADDEKLPGHEPCGKHRTPAAPIY
jgi:ParB family chromosome partitioning protein